MDLPFRQQLPAIQDEDIIGKLADQVHVVLDENNSFPPSPHLLQQPLHLLEHRREEASKGLVKKVYFHIHGQSPRDFEKFALSIREILSQV